MDPNRLWTRGAMWAKCLKVWIRWGGRRELISCWKNRGEKERAKCFFQRFTEFRRSEFVEQRVKVHLLDEGYAWVPKMRDLTKDPMEEISGNQIFRAREVSYSCYCASSGRDSSYLGLFLLLWIDSYLRGCLTRFYALRGCLAWVKTTLIAVLWPICGRFCVLICGCVICPKKCLGIVWIKKNYLDC